MHLDFKKGKGTCYFFNTILFCILLFLKKDQSPQNPFYRGDNIAAESFFFAFLSRDKYFIPYFNDAER